MQGITFLHWFILTNPYNKFLVWILLSTRWKSKFDVSGHCWCPLPSLWATWMEEANKNPAGSYTTCSWRYQLASTIYFIVAKLCWCQKTIAAYFLVKYWQNLFSFIPCINPSFISKNFELKMFKSCQWGYGTWVDWSFARKSSESSIHIWLIWFLQKKMKKASCSLQMNQVLRRH